MNIFDINDDDDDKIKESMTKFLLVFRIEMF